MKTPFHFFIRSNRKYIRISLSDLVWIESCRGYIKLHTLTKTWVVHTTMLELENLLPPDEFCRIHRSHIIAIGRVQSFDKEQVSLLDARNELIRLPIGQGGYKNALMQRITTIGETTSKVFAI